jgi:hypothetical protein
MPEGYSEFEFDLPLALKTALVGHLEATGSAELTSDTTSAIPDAQGVYQLFHENRLVYVGKTDAEAGLRTRLARHAKKILHRPTLTPNTVSFKALRVMVFTAMDLETQLIRHYKSTASDTCSWNGSGFGSNDPGRRREETNKPPEGFDSLHPISIDLPGDFIPAGNMTAAKAAALLKSNLPYTLRYETVLGPNNRAHASRPHPDLLAVELTVPPGPQTARGLMQTIERALGSDWQATAFASHLILYKERRDYTHGSNV